MRKKENESEEKLPFDKDEYPFNENLEDLEALEESEDLTIEEDEDKYFYEEKKTSLLNTIKNLFQKKKKDIPMTFNIGLSVLLFFCYLSIMFVSVPTAPSLLIIIIPTLYIIVRHIKLEREQLGEKYGS